MPDGLRAEIEQAVAHGERDGVLPRPRARLHGQEAALLQPELEHAPVPRGRGRIEDLELHDVPGTGDNEIHEHVSVDGSTGFLRTPLRHDDYRGSPPGSTATTGTRRGRRTCTASSGASRSASARSGSCGSIRFGASARCAGSGCVFRCGPDPLLRLVRRSRRFPRRAPRVRLLRADELVRVHHRRQASRARSVMDLRAGVSFEERDGIAVFPVESEHARAQAAHFDEGDDEFETERPRGTTPLYAWLIEEKFRRSIRGIAEVVSRGCRLWRCARLGDGRGAARPCRRPRRIGGHLPRRLPPRAGAGAAARARPDPGCRRRGGPAVRRPSFDLVYVHDGLHHLEHPEAGLAEMARVARRAVSITEPARAALTRAAVRGGLALEREDAGNRVARLDPCRGGRVLARAGLRRSGRGALRDALSAPSWGALAVPLAPPRLPGHRGGTARRERRRRAARQQADRSGLRSNQ